MVEAADGGEGGFSGGGAPVGVGQPGADLGGGDGGWCDTGGVLGEVGDPPGAGPDGAGSASCGGKPVGEVL